MENSRLKKLLEELGVAAAEPVHTDEKPAEHTPEVKEEEVHAGEQKAEEVEAPIVESYTREELEELFEELKLDTKKYTFGYLAEQLGFELLSEKPEVVIPAVSGEKEVPKAFILDDIPKAKHYGRANPENPIVDDMQGVGSGTRIYVTHDQAAELAKDGRFVDQRKIRLGKGEKPQFPGLVKDFYTLPELNEAFAAAGLDTKKFTTEYLAERMGFRQLSEAPWMLDPETAVAPGAVDHSTISYKIPPSASGDIKQATLVAKTKEGKDVRWVDPQFSMIDLQKAKKPAAAPSTVAPTVRESFANWSRSRALNEFNPYTQKKYSIDGVLGADLARKDEKAQENAIAYALRSKRKPGILSGGVKDINIDTLDSRDLGKLANMMGMGYSDEKNDLEVDYVPEGQSTKMWLRKKGDVFSKPVYGPISVFRNQAGIPSGGIGSLRKLIVKPSEAPRPSIKPTPKPGPKPEGTPPGGSPAGGTGTFKI